MVDQLQKYYNRLWWNNRNVFLGSKEKPYITVYRMENDEGYGPFRNSCSVEADGYRGSWVKKCRRRPILYLRPDQDFSMHHLHTIGFLMQHTAKCFQFGFKDIAQMKKWFNRDELYELSKMGYKLKRKKAAVCLFSDNQVLYAEDLPSKTYDVPADMTWAEFLEARSRTRAGRHHD